MSRKVKCVKLHQELDAMPFKPFDNELGQRIYDNVSKHICKKHRGKIRGIVFHNVNH